MMNGRASWQTKIEKQEINEVVQEQVNRLQFVPEYEHGGYIYTARFSTNDSTEEWSKIENGVSPTWIGNWVSIIFFKLLKKFLNIGFIFHLGIYLMKFVLQDFKYLFQSSIKKEKTLYALQNAWSLYYDI